MNSHDNNPIIAVEGVSMQWDRRLVLDNVNLVINEGDFVAITGPNGGGKTTLLRIILHLLRPTYGHVTFYSAGRAVSDLPIGYLPQKNMIDSHFPISVKEVVESGLLSGKGIARDEREWRINETIELMDLSQHARRPIGELSGGQLQRALLGRAIISRPKVLVLDEPLSYIDKRFEPRLYRIISDIAKDTTILLVSHEMTTIATMANRHLIVDVNLHECTAAHHYVHTECDE